MKNTQSLKKNFEFKIVYKRGISIANRQLIMYILPNKKNMNFLGISVSKKVGNSVVRSRTTRLIRESYRLNEESIKTGYNIVFIARNGAAGIPFSDMERSVKHLLKKQGLLLR